MTRSGIPGPKRPKSSATKTNHHLALLDFLVSPTEKERKHAFVRVQIEFGFDCFRVRFGLVVSMVWIGSEYGFNILLDESASESQMQNSTRTAP